MFQRGTLGLGLLVALVACSERLVGPRQRFELSPLVPQLLINGQPAPLPNGRLRVQISTGNGLVIGDTSVVVADTSTQVALSVRAQLRDARAALFALAELVGEEGDTLFRTPLIPVQLSSGPGGSPDPVTLPMDYVGPGAGTAAAIRLSGADTPGFSGDTLAVSGEVLDVNGNVIPRVPILWFTADSSVARVLRRFEGQLLLGAGRGESRVIARTYTGLADSAALRVEALPTAVEIQGSAAPADTVGRALGTALRVRLVAGDGLPVRGIGVRFTAAGVTVDAAEVVTDSLGIAATGAQLPTTAGAYTVTATPLRGQGAATFAITAIPAAVDSIALAGGPAGTVTAGDAVPAKQATLLDRFGNVVTWNGESVALRLLDADGAEVGTPRTVAATAGIATFASEEVERAGAGFVYEASLGATLTARGAPFTVLPAPASVLVVTSQPADTVVAGATIPALSVEARDAFGNRATAFAGEVAATLAANPGSASLGGTIVETAVGGVASFDALQLTRAAAGYTLAFSATGLVADTTAAFTVVAAAPAQLVVTTQPAPSNVAGTVFGPIVAAAQDAFGNATPTFTGTVTASLAVNPSSTTLGGTLQAATTDGVATFSDLVVTAAASGYRLAVSAAGLQSDTTAAFAIDAAPASALAITQQPAASVAAGSPIGPVVVAIRDAFDNVVTTFTDSVSLALGENPGAATLGGSTSVQAVAGIATFDAVTLARAASGYTLAVSTAALGPAITTAFDVAPAAAAALAITSGPPDSIVAGVTMPAVVAEIRDAFGNLVPDFAEEVTAALGANPTAATLAGTLVAEPVAGVVTFDALQLTRAGAGYTLLLTAPALASAESQEFVVVAAEASELLITQQPPETVGVGVPFSVTAALRDAFENVVTTFTDTVRAAIAVNPGSGTLGGTVAVVPAAGIATFPDLVLETPGVGYTLQLDAAALTATTTAITVTSDAPAFGYWRFEDGGFLVSTGSNAPLTAAGAVPPQQVALADLGASSAFPRTLPAGANASASQLAGSGSATRFTASVRRAPSFTLEALVNTEAYTGRAAQRIAGLGAPGAVSWSLEIRQDGSGGSTQGELVLRGSAPSEYLLRSGLVLTPDVDYYVAVAFDAAGSATFWLRDLTAGTALQSEVVSHALAPLADDLSFAIGGAFDGDQEMEFRGLIDEVRLSDRVLEVSELYVPLGAAPEIVLTPSPLAFTSVAGAASAVEREVAISNGGGGVLDGLLLGAVTYAQGQPTGWLQVGELSASSAPATVVLTASASALPVGSYTATLQVLSSAAGIVNSPQLLSVEFTVNAAPDVRQSKVGAGQAHSCSTDAGGEISCAGLNDFGRLGDGTTTSSLTPVSVAVPPGVTLQNVATGSRHNCGLTPGGAAYCWGDNGSGQLGDGTTEFRSVPTPVAAPPGVAFTQIAPGQLAVCGVTAAGDAYCWGLNQRGVLGDGTLTQRLTPTLVAAPEGVRFVQVSNGWVHSCALSDTGVVYCWGGNTSGELGDGTNTDRLTPVPVASPPGVSFRQVAASSNRTCAVATDGSAYCWGQNNAGQLGDGTTTARNVPTLVQAGGVEFAEVTPFQPANGLHTCGVSAAGAAYCWGANGSGQLGDGTQTQRLVPVPVVTAPGAALTQIVTGLSHTCARSAQGETYCWGLNFNGQLGDGTTVSRPLAVAFGTLAPPEVRLSSSELTLLGAVGQAAEPGQVVTITNAGLGSLTDLSLGAVAYADGEPTGWLEVGALSTTTAPATFTVRASPGSLPVGTYTATVSVESAASGVIGTPRTLTVTFLVNEPVAPTRARVSAGSYSCVLQPDGTALCAGQNGGAQLGDGTALPRQFPVVVAAPVGVTFEDISVMGASACAVAPSGTAYCWGQGGGGVLGNGGTAGSFVPTPVSAEPGVSYAQVSMGGSHACATTESGDAYCWGSNFGGELGDGTTTSRLSPVRVSAAEGLSFAQVSAGLIHSCGVTRAGSVYCWGANPSGQLGDGTLGIVRTQPVRAMSPAGVRFTQVTAFSSSTCALTGAGTVYCWGQGSSGQLGNGLLQSGVLTPIPVTMPQGVTFTRLRGWSGTVCAVSAAGAAYCWGLNTSGEVGNGTTTAALVPTLVTAPAGVSWGEVAAGAQFSCALTTSAVPYCWGANLGGRLGDGTTVQRLTPVRFITGAAIRPSQDSVAILAIEGENDASPVTITVTNGGPLGDLTGLSLGAVSYASGEPTGWLSLGALTATSAPASFTLTASATSLPAGTYTATVPIRSSVPDIAYPERQLTVALTVYPPITPSLTTVSAGQSHSCALSAGGDVYCAGSNNSGQLGDGSFVSQGTPVRAAAPGGSVFVQVSAGALHTCGLTEGGSAFCWGSNTDGALGDGTATTRTSPVAVAIPDGVTFIQISAGLARTCALASTGVAYCWGGGATGDGSSGSRATPVAVAMPASVLFRQVAAGYGQSCAVAFDGSVYCWGENGSGQLGDGSTSTRLSPVRVATPAGVSFTQVATGQQYSCAVATTGAAYCWGSQTSSGQLGDGSLATRLTPVPVAAPGESFTQISARSGHTCATTATGGVRCWGLNTEGQLGDSTMVQRLSPVTATSLATLPVNQISVGAEFSCAALSTGGIRCWGRNEEGQLGDGSARIAATPLPVLVPDGESFASVSSGDAHSCATAGSGATFCWGLNESGRLGDGSNDSRATPVRTAGSEGLTFAKVANGTAQSCARTSTGSIYCWGNNAEGQLGDGTVTPRSIPVAILAPGGVSFADVASGFRHSCAVATTGEAYCWGWGANGRLGTGSTSTSTVPALVLAPEGVTFTQVATGPEHSCALSSTGSIYCWGFNGSGRLGDGTTTTRLAPTLVNAPGLTFVRISVGSIHSCGLTDTGAIHCWGANGVGQLGDGSFVNRLSPTAVSAPGIVFTELFAGFGNTCATTADGSGYCWGGNGSGNIGDGSTEARALPTLVNAPGVSFASLAPGAGQTCGTTVTGDAYCWGLRLNGRLGDNYPLYAAREFVLP